MKNLKKLFLMLLVGITILGTGVLTNNETIKAAQPKYKSVFSIDAGRKYFSFDQLKQIIDKAHQNGYTDVQILLGNDGLRLFLDDMTIEANGKTYASEDVKKAITVGNKAYYDDPNGNALTQAEMDVLLSYAKERNIGIIPVINSPGHMDSILVAMQELGISAPHYKQSERTVDLENTEAINFTKALITKYAKYFGPHCSIFNFGADEYANDILHLPEYSNNRIYSGWKLLQVKGLYPKLIAYVNDLAKIVKDAGMEPMCFNDGIYYNQNDTEGTFDKDIIVSYWTAGWWEFYVAPAKYLSDKGHRIMNTNDSWYWVVGNVESGGYNYKDMLSKIDTIKFTDVTGQKNDVIPIIGSVQAVWCDDPKVEHDMTRLLNLLDVYSTKHSEFLIRPADYTKVNEAKASVPADLTLYTPESVQALTSALSAVDTTKRVDEQAVVDAYAQAIITAVSGLQYKDADYAKVDAAITKANSLNKNKYKDFSKVSAAIAAVKRGYNITQQNDVDAMANAINDAIDNLVLKPVKSPNTGDTTNQNDFIGLLTLSGAVISFALFQKLKRNKLV